MVWTGHVLPVNKLPQKMILRFFKVKNKKLIMFNIEHYNTIFLHYGQMKGANPPFVWIDECLQDFYFLSSQKRGSRVCCHLVVSGLYTTWNHCAKLFWISFSSLHEPSKCFYKSYSSIHIYSHTGGRGCLTQLLNSFKFSFLAKDMTCSNSMQSRCQCYEVIYLLSAI